VPTSTQNATIDESLTELVESSHAGGSAEGAEPPEPVLSLPKG